jgi:Winged helix-turn helix
MFREVSMVEVREVLRLRQQGRYLREIARLTGLDRKTVRRYLELAAAAGHRPGRAGGARALRHSSEPVRTCRKGSAREITAGCYLIQQGGTTEKAWAGACPVLRSKASGVSDHAKPATTDRVKTGHLR